MIGGLSIKPSQHSTWATSSRPLADVDHRGLRPFWFFSTWFTKCNDNYLRVLRILAVLPHGQKNAFLLFLLDQSLATIEQFPFPRAQARPLRKVENYFSFLTCWKALEKNPEKSFKNPLLKILSFFSFVPSSPPEVGERLLGFPKALSEILQRLAKGFTNRGYQQVSKLFPWGFLKCSFGFFCFLIVF